jgi:hypothetical protein
MVVIVIEAVEAAQEAAHAAFGGGYFADAREQRPIGLLGKLDLKYIIVRPYGLWSTT